MENADDIFNRNVKFLFDNIDIMPDLYDRVYVGPHRTILQKLRDSNFIEEMTPSVEWMKESHRIADELIASLNFALERPNLRDEDLLRRNREFIRKNRHHMGWLNELVEDCGDSEYWPGPMKDRIFWDDFIPFCEEEINSRR